MTFYGPPPQPWMQEMAGMHWSWYNALQPEFLKPYFIDLSDSLIKERNQYGPVPVQLPVLLSVSVPALVQLKLPDLVYPPPNDVFSWTRACSPDLVKVVILGQDPYPGPGQAHGLAFSMLPGLFQKIPQSLQNIYDELQNEYSGPNYGHLMDLAQQGLARSLLSGNQSINDICTELLKMILGYECQTNYSLMELAEQGLACSESLEDRSQYNLFTEIQNTISGFQTPNHGYLMGWAKQGVLLLNTILTVREGDPKSHQNLGWETFTDAVISLLSRDMSGIVFMLWGKDAQQKEKLINKDEHCVLKASHPSSKSAKLGFFECNHFLRCNKYLVSPFQIKKNNQVVEKMSKTPIKWTYLPSFN